MWWDAKYQLVKTTVGTRPQYTIRVPNGLNFNEGQMLKLNEPINEKPIGIVRVSGARHSVPRNHNMSGPSMPPEAYNVYPVTFIEDEVGRNPWIHMAEAMSDFQMFVSTMELKVNDHWERLQLAYNKNSGDPIPLPP